MWKLIDQLRKVVFFKLLTIYLRYLIGFAFVFASFIKMKGDRFTSIPVTEPIGYFFEAMYQTGFYWKFLGLGQFISGALLMSQRFSTIGAFIFLPVILNVFVITHAINFGNGTPTITTLMLLGTIYLLLWDHKKWIILFQKDHRIKLDLTSIPEDKFMTDPIWTATGMLFILLTALLWLTEWRAVVLWASLMLAAGLAAFVIVLVRYRRTLKVVKSSH